MHANLDITPLPEIVQVGALVGEEWSKPMANNPIQGSPRAFTEFVRLVSSGGVVSEVFGQRDGLARFRVDLEHHPPPSSPQLDLKEETHSVSSLWSMPHANPIPETAVVKPAG